jgi:predicted RNA methylase
MSDDFISKRYTSSAYLDSNPSWDLEDSPWKARQVATMLQRHAIVPASIAEIGCGAGGVLSALRQVFPAAELYGFDIAPAAARFWERHAQDRITFQVGDFFALSQRRYEAILLLDVLEHLANPFEFLRRARAHADHVVLHMPLDLSALSVLRETPLTYVREKVGHLHHWTKGLALALVEDSGFEVVDWSYTGAAFTAPQRTAGTRMASLARRLVFAVHRDAGVRLLGGETIVVLARPRSPV